MSCAEDNYHVVHSISIKCNPFVDGKKSSIKQDFIHRTHRRPSVPDMTMELSSQTQRIVLFGDQTESVLPAIQTLYKRAPSSIYIQHFLRVSIDAARQSLEELCNGSEKIRFQFDSFLTLAEQSSQRQCPDVVVQTLLLCVAQLGHLILYVHRGLKSQCTS